MARSRFDNLDDDAQESLLREAGEEFADKGYESASLNAIIEKAGISKGSLYYYFDDKEDLFSTVVQRATSKLMAHVTDFALDELTAETFWDELERVVREMADYTTEHRWYFRLARTFYRVRDDQPGTVRDSNLYEVSRRWAVRIIERGQQLGVVRTDLPREYLVELCMALAEAGDRWILDRIEEYDDADIAREAERQMDVYRRVLSPDLRPENEVDET